MKKLTYIFLSLLVLAGCTGASRQPQLVAMDSLLLSRPDSALTLLRGMSFTDKADRMYHYLLLADACNKCYDTLPSDTILQEVADYYDRHGMPNEQVRAHYLLGCAYRDMGEAPHALDCYQTAVSRADTTSSDCNYRLLMSVYGQMASIFHRQNLPQDELNATKEYGKSALLAKDSFNYISSIEMSVKAYGIMEDTLKVEELIKESQRLYKQLGFPHMAIRENIILIHNFIQRGEYQKAKRLMSEYESESKLFDNEGNIAKGRESYYYIKGNYYRCLNNLDSAEHYMRKLLRDGNKVDAYRGLLGIYREKRIIDSIESFSNHFEEAIDSVNAKRQTETIHQMASSYNYYRFQKIAANKSLEAANARTNSFFILGISIMVIISSVSVYFYYRRKKNAKIQQLNDDLGRAIFEYNKVSVELEDQKRYNSSLRQEKKEQTEIYKVKIKEYQQRLKANNSNLQLSNFKERNIVQQFMTKSKGNPKYPLPTDVEWKRLTYQFSRYIPSIYSALGRDVILSQNELRVCMLIILGFNLTDIAILLDTTHQSISNIKTKANQKLFNESSATSLEKNLMQIVGMV